MKTALWIMGAILLVSLVVGGLSNYGLWDIKKGLIDEITVRKANDGNHDQQIADLRQKTDSLEKEQQKQGKRIGSVERRTVRLEKNEERIVNLLVVMTDTIREQKQAVKVAPKKKGKNKAMSLEEALEEVELALEKSLSK